MKFTAMASNPMMAWLIFYNARLVPLQEATKAHYRVKHSENEFANERNHINEIVNF